MSILLHLLKDVISTEEQTVVFAATKHHVEYLNMVVISNLKLNYRLCIVFGLLLCKVYNFDQKKFNVYNSFMFHTYFVLYGIG